jgi:hypothetical protein
MTATPSLPERARAVPHPVPIVPVTDDETTFGNGIAGVLALPPHRFLRGDSALRLARYLLAGQLAAPRHRPLSPAQLARLNEQLPLRLARGSRRERAGLLAVAAALGPELSPAARAAVARIGRNQAGPDGEAGESVAAHITGLLAAGFPVSDPQLVDLATLVRSPAALLSLAGTGDNRRRATALVLAIAEQAATPGICPPV